MENPVSSSPPAVAPGPPGPSREPMSTAARRGILALVIFFHVGGGWALTQVEPVKLIVGEVAPMEVRMVPSDEPPQPEIENAEPPPPVEIPPPPVELATVVDPPPPDLPPPEFPLAKVELPPPDEPPPVDIPPEKKPDPKPPEPKPVQRKPPQPARPAAPVDSQPQQAAPAAPAAPRTVDASQLGWLIAPNPVYSTKMRRAGVEGTAIVRILVDVTGRPAQVSLAQSSGSQDIDEEALRAVRASQLRPYAPGGLAQPVVVHQPVRFTLK